ncbi:hypothetical protein F5Y15DRAFT_205597 [Xylariaceae sp. FL0016]|nr:hypothetical protein F5Y15DRAFT_205597 [Xylariaceae sp. FL0016]
MSFGPQVVMPGAFHFEAPNGGAPLSGVHPGIFRPPMSPSASSSLYIGRSTGSLHSDPATPGPNVKRKRHRARDSISYNDWTEGLDAGLPREGLVGDRFDSERRMSGGQTRYVLAGQIETPNGAVQKRLEDMDDSVYSDIDYRRALGSKRIHNQTETTQARDPQSRPHAGWSSFAISTLGGVVGKVWEFCKAGAFRGFYAGGGRGFEIQVAPGQTTASGGQVWCNEHNVPSLPEYGLSPFPGGFPESDYSPFHYERETPDSTPPPAAKRRQINSGASKDELRRNWVMVNEPDEKQRQSSSVSRPSSETHTHRIAPPLTRRISKPVSRLSGPALDRQHSGRISHAGSASLSHREPASFASPRSPVTPQRSSSRLPVPSRPQSPNTFSPTRLSQQPSRIPSPSVYGKSSHRRSHSAISASAVSTAAAPRMRKRESMQELQDSSPRLDAEARVLAARRMQEEMELDTRVDDFTARLRDMIRQGKEALGTTVEVEGEGDVGGNDPWEDD